jgi:hypothetical protein
MPIAIPVLDAGSVEQVAVQLAAGQAVGLDGLGEAQRPTPPDGVRGQQRVTRRVAHDGLKRAGRLGPAGTASGTPAYHLRASLSLPGGDASHSSWDFDTLAPRRDRLWLKR